MPADKKGKGKKAKKEEDKVEETEYDNMDLEMLQEVVPMLKQQLEKSMLDRNYVQLERDTIQTFYNITREEVRSLEMAIAAKDREMELMEDNHRVEVRVYVQKVKHLDYEHGNNLAEVGGEARALLAEETARHAGHEEDLQQTKADLKAELRDWARLNAEEIAQVNEANHKNLTKMREGFELGLGELKARCAQRLEQLEEDLDLRHKVEVHELEERKNMHINDLMKNHTAAFGQMKQYYNAITGDNLRLIRSLKDELTEMRTKAAANQKLMQDISQENKRLSEPLAVAVAEVAELRASLKDRAKDRLSLANATARLRLLDGQLEEVTETQAELEATFAAVEQQRDELYDRFEDAVRRVQQRSDFKNVVLERRLAAMEADVRATSSQLQEVAAAGALHEPEVSKMMRDLDQVVAGKNAAVQTLQYQLTRAAKAYNDALRTHTAKLLACGVPEDEVRAMGFATVPLAAGVGPAGLVAG
ncbi:unnamed protein product [Phaeothamnion confervicola]